MEWTSRSQRNDSVVKSNVSVIASSLVKDQLYLSVAINRQLYTTLTISLALSHTSLWLKQTDSDSQILCVKPG